VTARKDNVELPVNLEKLESIIGSQRIWVLVDYRNKQFTENLVKLRSLISSYYPYKENELSFYKTVKDVKNYPKVEISKREKLFLEQCRGANNLLSITF